MNALRAVLLLGVLLVSAPAFADEIFEKIGTVGGLSYGIAPHERVAAGITYKRIEEKLADVSFTGAGWDLGGCYRHPVAIGDASLLPAAAAGVEVDVASTLALRIGGDDSDETPEGLRWGFGAAIRWGSLSCEMAATRLRCGQVAPLAAKPSGYLRSHSSRRMPKPRPS
jgi:hypothetical protein